MDSNEFLQEHAKWKYGKGVERKPEQPATWLISDSGCYFPLEGDLDHELERLRGIGMPCVVWLNSTSTTMRDKQNEILARRQR
jgi:hypothetical protein